MFVAKMKENGEIDKESIQELNCKEIEDYDIVGEPSTGKVFGFAFPYGYDISNAENKYTAVADICMQICEHLKTREDMIVRLKIDDCIVNTIAIHNCVSDNFEILDDFDEGNKSIVIELITSVSMASDFLSQHLPPFNAY